MSKLNALLVTVVSKWRSICVREFAH